MINKKSAVLILIFFSITSVYAQSYGVKVAGKMSKIGKENRAGAAILVDTIKYSNFYALGPVDHWRGEIIIWDYKRYIAALSDDKKLMVLNNVEICYQINSMLVT